MYNNRFICDTILCIIINLNSVSGSRSSTNYQGPNPNQIFILPRPPVSMPWPDPIIKKPNLNYHSHPSGNGRWEMIVATNFYLSFFLSLYLCFLLQNDLHEIQYKSASGDQLDSCQSRAVWWLEALIMDDGPSINVAHLTILTLDLCVTPEKKNLDLWA